MYFPRYAQAISEYNVFIQSYLDQGRFPFSVLVRKIQTYYQEDYNGRSYC